MHCYGVVHWCTVAPGVSVAFAARGLVMPESPLMADLGSDDRAVWTFVITGAGVALVGVLGVSLKEPAKQWARRPP
jgi:hypothetical protein